MLIALFSGSTPLHVAAASGSVANVKTLLECGHDVASIDESGRTPLFHAAESGSEKLLKLLLQVLCVLNLNCVIVESHAWSVSGVEA